ncbi:hypothetical protein FRAAL4912 [Frankia alni ACN14a]|uniref:Uncharacterized protein n=1 Tax=Frankia alni (strain DSM 45986 / CECT 9034 / ACN14a) TaxID=326424 RepID=Q0RG36_FRAAA|nr:hypothetical protein FRAAL4912 [Frankia alni ACN14a]
MSPLPRSAPVPTHPPGGGTGAGRSCRRRQPAIPDEAKWMPVDHTTALRTESKNDPTIRQISDSFLEYRRAGS